MRSASPPHAPARGALIESWHVRTKSDFACTVTTSIGCLKVSIVDPLLRALDKVPIICTGSSSVRRCTFYSLNKPTMMLLMSARAAEAGESR